MSLGMMLVGQHYVAPAPSGAAKGYVSVSYTHLTLPTNREV